MKRWRNGGHGRTAFVHFLMNTVNHDLVPQDTPTIYCYNRGHAILTYPLGRRGHWDVGPLVDPSFYLGPPSYFIRDSQGKRKR